MRLFRSACHLLLRAGSRPALHDAATATSICRVDIGSPAGSSGRSSCSTYELSFGSSIAAGATASISGHPLHNGATASITRSVATPGGLPISIPVRQRDLSLWGIHGAARQVGASRSWGLKCKLPLPALS
jgi:hypothetical protein